MIFISSYCRKTAAAASLAAFMVLLLLGSVHRHDFACNPKATDAAEAVLADYVYDDCGDHCTACDILASGAGITTIVSPTRMTFSMSTSGGLDEAQSHPTAITPPVLHSRAPPDVLTARGLAAAAVPTWGEKA